MGRIQHRARSVARTIAGWLLLLASLLGAGTATAQTLERATVSADNHLVTAFGTPLRGAPFFLGVYSTWDYNGGMVTRLPEYREYFLRAVSENNLSAVRCAPWVGNHEFFRFDRDQQFHQDNFDIILDNCVAWAEEAGIYAIVNYHTQYNTRINAAYTKGFWDRYAPRYQSQPHVIFELINEPNVRTAKKTMQGIYDHVRAMAPDTHMILWSLADPTAMSASDIRRATPGIDYAADNVSVGWHNYRDVGDLTGFDHADGWREAGLPIINTEYWSLTDRNDFPISYGHIADNVRESEARGHSWIGWGPYLNYEVTSRAVPHETVAFTPEFRDAVVNGATTLATQSGLSNGEFREGLGSFWDRWSPSITPGGGGEPPTFEDTVAFGSAPGQVDLSGVFNVTADYVALGARDLVLEVYRQGDGAFLGEGRTTVAEGSGTVAVSASVGPIEAGLYRLVLTSRDTGADRTNPYGTATRDNVSAQGDGGGGNVKPTLTLNAADHNGTSGGVDTYPGTGVGNMGPGSWVKFRRVDLGEGGYARVRLQIASAGPGVMEVRRGKANGQLLATVAFDGTSYDFADAVWRSAPLEFVEYRQNLFFRVSSGYANLADIQFVDE